MSGWPGCDATDRTLWARQVSFQSSSWSMSLSCASSVYMRMVWEAYQKPFFRWGGHISSCLVSYCWWLCLVQCDFPAVNLFELFSSCPSMPGNGFSEVFTVSPSKRSWWVLPSCDAPDPSSLLLKIGWIFALPQLSVMFPDDHDLTKTVACRWHQPAPSVCVDVSWNFCFSDDFK